MPGLRHAAALLTLFAGPLLRAQDIPKGVHYKPATEAVNKTATDILTTALTHPAAPSLFDTTVTVGPILWDAMHASTPKPVLDSKSIVTLVDGIQTESRGLITPAQQQAFWQSLLKLHPELATAKVRQANTQEIAYFWRTIPFDIEAPLLTIESGDLHLIANFTTHEGKPTLFWIDQVGDLSKLTTRLGGVVDLKVLNMMAATGAPGAERQLGGAYFLGEAGLAVDKPTAITWLQKAADGGDLPAQMFLGIGFVSGAEGIPRDYGRGAKNLQLAAAQNNDLAQYVLSILYAEGSGVEKSAEKSHQYLQAAADHSNANAEYALGSLYYDGRDGVPVDKLRACGLFDRALQHGNQNALNNLGFCYQIGYGGAPDKTKALALFLRAADNRELRGAGNAAALYEATGDFAESYFWFKVVVAEGAKDAGVYAEKARGHLTPEQIAAQDAKVEAWMKAHPAKR